MGMFDRPANFGERFNVGDRFILTGLTYEGSIGTVHGQAQRTTARIVTRDNRDRKAEAFTMLGEGFAEQAKRAERADFPAVVEYVKIPTGNGDREVKRLERVDVDPKAWYEGDDGPPLDMAAISASATSGTDDETPF